MNILRKIHIIGGGISGLYAAILAQQKFPQAQIVLYESGKDLGGRCRSFYSSALGIDIDNATHVILGANKYSNQLWKDVNFIKFPSYYNLQTSEINTNTLKHLQLLLRSVFNTNAKDIDNKCLQTLICKLFPYSRSKLKICYSEYNLSSNLIRPLASKVAVIKYNHCLRKVQIAGDKITHLVFTNQHIPVKEDELVISALDSHNYHKNFGGFDFSYNRIINIVYRTSQKLSLPNNTPMLGLEQASFDWVFTTPDSINVTLSDAHKNIICNKDFAIKIWQELCKIRGVNAAFMPAFQILDYPRATIKQDTKNNRLRPHSAQTPYSNMLQCGDWTLKNWPCCIEAALVSAQRAIKAIKLN